MFRIYVGIFEFLSLKSREYQKVKNLGFWKFDGKIQRRSSKKKHKKEKPTSLKETKSNKPSDKKKKRSSTKIADTKSEKRRYGKHSGPTAAKKNEKIIKKHTELI